jgi:transposase
MTKRAVAVLGIDLGKNSCSVAGLDETGCVILRRRLNRDGVVRLAAGMPACVMAMEACCGAHHLGRVLRDQGHEVRLMSPEYVQPYVKAQKNDERDAEAIAEAATRPTMRFVELKSEAQLDMQILHRARTRLVAERTALINQLRALLLERGIIIAKGRSHLEQHLALMLDDGMQVPGTLSPRTLLLIEDRGNTYLRTLLIHGARAALPSLSESPTAIGDWLRTLSARAHKNKVIVALAGKLARIAWAVLRSGQGYQRGDVAVTA